MVRGYGDSIVAALVIDSVGVGVDVVPVTNMIKANKSFVIETVSRFDIET